MIEILVEHSNQLTTLNIAGLLNSVSDSELGRLGELENLLDFDCSRCLNIYDDGMHNFLNSNINLKNLKASGLIKITDKSLKNIINKFHESIEELDLSCLFQKEISDDGIQNLNKCKKLQKINLAGSNFKDVSNLTTLSCIFSINVSRIVTIENSFITSLIVSGAKIVRASGCTQLNDTLMENILQLDKCGLLLLEINVTPKITDVAIARVMEKYSPNLRVIRATNLVWDPKNYGLRLPLPPVGYERPILKGMKKAPKKKNNDKNPIKMLEKFNQENKPTVLLEYFNKF